VKNQSNIFDNFYHIVSFKAEYENNLIVKDCSNSPVMYYHEIKMLDFSNFEMLSYSFRIGFDISI